MGTLASLMNRGQAVQIFLIVGVSILVALMFGSGLEDKVVILGGVLLFVLLVWDLRLLIPIQIVLVPLGPKYDMSFGNLYVATPVMIIAFAAWIVRNFTRRTPFSFTRNRMLPALAVFLLVLVLSAMQDIGGLFHDLPSLLRFIQFFFYASLLVMILQMDMSRRFVKGMLILLIVAGVAQGIIGLWQWAANPGYYVYGTFIGHHSSFAIYVVFICMLMLGALFEMGRPGPVTGLLAGLAVLLVALILSFSRTGYMSFIAGVIIFLFLPVRRNRRLALLAGTTAIVLISYSMVPESIRLRAGSIFTNLSGQDVGISFGTRLSMWRDVLRDFAASPILGKGAWTYSLTDNFFMKLLGEAGIVGLASFMWLIYMIFAQEWRAVKARVDDGLVRGMAIGLVPATVACLIIFNFAGDMFGVHRFMGSFWIVLALTQRYCLGGSADGIGNTDAAGKTDNAGDAAGAGDA
jgi:O-antigen ligase